ncbi:MAG: DUF5131 family protein [Anaerolineae bacterium]|nr:DUF5131 family protein [Anaerolineae bacterium]
MHRSKISWTDYSGGYANFVWRGKRKGDCEYSPGCQHCYVVRCWIRQPDLWPDETTFYPDKLERLRRCRPRANGHPYRRGTERPMIFPNDTGDLFHANVPSAFIFNALDTFYIRSDVDWQILTKRIDRAASLIRTWLFISHYDHLPPWMWIMASAEDQKCLDERLPWLEQIPAVVRGLSVEPMLGPVVLPDWALTQHILSWVIAGGETGRAARPMHPDWVRNLRDQCTANGITFHFKSWGEWKAADDALQMIEYARLTNVCCQTSTSPLLLWGIGRDRAGRTLDGREWDEFPEVLT